METMDQAKRKEKRLVAGTSASWRRTIMRGHEPVVEQHELVNRPSGANVFSHLEPSTVSGMRRIFRIATRKKDFSTVLSKDGDHFSWDKLETTPH